MSSTSKSSRAFELRHGIAADGASAPQRELSLRSDRALYVAGSPIMLSLNNNSMSTFGTSANCTTPTAVWLRSSSGSTYFVNSGRYSACASGLAILPGSSAPIATVDSGMVWVDESTTDKLFRMPRALPRGSYTVHALTSRGELTTKLEIR